MPILFCAYSPSFRSEAGSYGKDTRGLIRQHQFNKVELVNIVAEEKSQEAHENMIGRAKEILELLDLPYRSMNLCSGLAVGRTLIGILENYQTKEGNIEIHSVLCP